MSIFCSRHHCAVQLSIHRSIGPNFPHSSASINHNSFHFSSQPKKSIGVVSQSLASASCSRLSLNHRFTTDLARLDTLHFLFKTTPGPQGQATRQLSRQRPPEVDHAKYLQYVRSYSTLETPVGFAAAGPRDCRDFDNFFDRSRARPPVIRKGVHRD